MQTAPGGVLQQSPLVVHFSYAFEQVCGVAVHERPLSPSLQYPPQHCVPSAQLCPSLRQAAKLQKPRELPA
jgi:hypothetical protein